MVSAVRKCTYHVYLLRMSAIMHQSISPWPCPACTLLSRDSCSWEPYFSHTLLRHRTFSLLTAQTILPADHTHSAQPDSSAVWELLRCCWINHKALSAPPGPAQLRVPESPLPVQLWQIRIPLHISCPESSSRDTFTYKVHTENRTEVLPEEPRVFL